MSVLYLVLPLGLVLSACFLWACQRAIRSGQYDDLETPAHRLLLDEETS